MGGHTQRWGSWMVSIICITHHIIYIYRLLLYKMTRTKRVFTSLTLSLCYNVDLHARGEVINGGFGLLLDGSEVRYYTSPFRRPRSSHFKICRMQLKGQR